MNNGFKRFTNPLFNTPVKMVNVPVQKMFRMSAPQEIFYSVKDGNWSDRTIWETVSGRPANRHPNNATDDVYIRNTVALDVPANTNYLVRDIYIAANASIQYGSAVGGGRNLYVIGNFKCEGTWNSTGVNSAGLFLYGYDNYINKKNHPTFPCDIYYMANLRGQNNDIDASKRQAIFDLTYTGLLYLGGFGEKYLTGPTVCNIFVNQGGFGNGASFNINGFDFTCTSTFTLQVGMVFSLIGSPKITFMGNVDVVAAYFAGTPIFDFRANIINWGHAINGYLTPGGSIFGNGIVNFTTANKDVRINNVATNMTGALMVIDNGIEVTINSSTVAYVDNIINGSNGASKLINKGNLIFATQLAAENSMTTGIVDFTTNANTIQFNGNYSATIPSYFTTFHNLTIGGTGTKTLGVNTILNGNLTISNSGTFQLSTYNLIVNGTTTLNNNTASTLLSILKSGAGNVVFVGLLNVSQGSGGSILDFSGGNPTVECRGGITSSALYGGIYGYFSTGAGQWTFSTNNQTIFGNFYSVPFNCPIVINNGITVSITSSNGGSVTFNNTVNGGGATSKLLMGASGVLNFGTSTAATSIMPTGTWDFTTNANTVQFSGNYSATISSNITTFSSLTIGGTGTKTLGVNTTVNGNLSITSTVSATDGLDISTFNLLVTGTSSITTLSATGAGNITFVGAVTMANGQSQLWRGFNFGGNPNVEFRNGLTLTNNRNLVMGTGNYTFTTNSQTLSITNANALFPNGTIVGNITVTFNANETANGFNTNPIGTVAGSTLRNQGAIRLNGNPSGVMSTGVFDVTTFTTNVVIYGFNGAATIPLTTYYGLRIDGTGIKTLSGNTTLLSTLSVSIGTLECSTFNLIVTGSTSVSPDAKLSKNAAGNITFIGAVVSNAQSSLISAFDFSGNPNVEFRAGLSLVNAAASVLNTGTGTFTFTTANQNLDIVNRTNAPFNCNIVIDNNIVLTFTNSGGSGFTAGIIHTGLLNGNNAASTFRIASNGAGTPLTYNYQNATQPMATGILDTSTNANTWIYGLNNQDIKGGPTTLAKQVYRNLILNGTGTKTLQGYVSVLNTYTLTSPATLALNGYTLTNP